MLQTNDSLSLVRQDASCAGGKVGGDAGGRGAVGDGGVLCSDQGVEEDEREVDAAGHAKRHQVGKAQVTYGQLCKEKVRVAKFCCFVVIFGTFWLLEVFLGSETVN